MLRFVIRVLDTVYSLTSWFTLRSLLCNTLCTVLHTVLHSVLTHLAMCYTRVLHTFSLVQLRNKIPCVAMKLPMHGGPNPRLRENIMHAHDDLTEWAASR